MHPLGGGLSVKQTVVPLEVEISKFGNAPLTGDRIFQINSLTINEIATPFTSVEDFFAPAQFLDLTDDEKLACPSFESLPAGLSVTAKSFSVTDSAPNIIEDEAIAYETIFVDSKFEAETNEKRRGKEFKIDIDMVELHLYLGSAVRRSPSRSGNNKYSSERKQNIEAPDGWTIISRKDGLRHGAPGFAEGSVVSFTESYQALRKLKAGAPSEAKDRMLIRARG